MTTRVRRPRTKVDPELRRQLDLAAAETAEVEAVLRLRPPVRRSGRKPEAVASGAEVRETARTLLARVADEVGVSASDYDWNALPNLGFCVLRAPAGFVERVLRQPEVASASANRRG